MIGKRGTTLIEAVIAVFVVAIVIVTLLQALSSGVFGTLTVNRMTSALNLAKSQLENVSAQTYNASIGNGNLSNTYGLITANGGNIIDKTNYNISGSVSQISSTLQKIAVNVSYLNGKQIQLIGYKNAGGSFTSITTPYRYMLVTDNIQNVPELYSGSGGSYVGCTPLFSGYYHVFNTSGGPVSITWNFNWVRWNSGVTSIGSPVIAIYAGIPVWANRDYLGVVKSDGIIYREDAGGWLGAGGVGDLPGPGSGDDVCNCYCQNCPNELNPVWWVPHDCLGLYGGYPCQGACGDILDIGEDVYWHYDGGDLGLWSGYPLADSGTFDRTMTTTLSAGTYTILFFNAEDLINIQTTTAAIAYSK